MTPPGCLVRRAPPKNRGRGRVRRGETNLDEPGELAMHGRRSASCWRPSIRLVTASDPRRMAAGPAASAAAREPLTPLDVTWSTSRRFRPATPPRAVLQREAQIPAHRLPITSGVKQPANADRATAGSGWRSLRQSAASRLYPQRNMPTGAPRDAPDDCSPTAILTSVAQGRTMFWGRRDYVRTA